MIRVKVVALLLGPSGVGLIGLFTNILQFAGTLSGLGINSSAVRQIAQENKSGNFENFGRAVKTLIIASLITGILGWLLVISFAKQLSLWTFSNNNYVWSFAILGSVVFLNTVFKGQLALLQGVRRIKYFAKVLVFSSLAETIISIVLYYFLHEKGIIIALISCAMITLFFSWWFAVKIDVPKVSMSWKDFTTHFYPMVTLGMAFMWATVLSTGVTLITRSLVIRTFGIDAGGIYQAAWGISGLFAGFILQAMGSDFYPRLIEVANNNDRINQYVNEQIEIGILITLPGLLATLAFSPLVIKLFYSAAFIQSSEMLPWFIVGIFGRVICWPTGYILIAKKASVLFAVKETLNSILHVFLIWIGIRHIGIVGVAIAFAVIYIWNTAIINILATRISGYRWSRTVIIMIGLSVMLIILEIAILEFFAGMIAALVSLLIIFGSGIYSLRQLTERLGPEHRITKLVSNIPGLSPFKKA